MHFLNSLTLSTLFFVSVRGWADRGKPVVAGYYPSYKAHVQAPSAIPWSHYTHIDYFVIPVKASADQLPVENEANLRETVQLARAHNVSISLTLGGWTGSGAFSTIVGSKESRDNFATSIVSLVKKYEVDGIDIDWEYPGMPAQDGNAYSSADSEHFLELLTTLREKLGKDSRISAAVSMKGLMGSDGQFLANTRAFSDVLDHLTIMAYDAYVSGAGNTIAGPTAPLYHTCSDPQNRISVSSAIEGWIKTGFNPSKILLGLPAYGYGYTLLGDSLKPTHFSSTNKTSLLFQAASPTSQGGPSAGGGGQWLYQELHKNNKLSEDSTKGTSGYQRQYDNCTHTPFLYHPETKHLIVYDDAGSILEKTRLAKQYQLGGVNVFDTTGDTPDLHLTRAIHITYPVNQDGRSH
ncbi:hypothetical protein CROQUDRAFT_133275 [Cronartium quercuum f. sp. fusiforme G11]|uniref:GH18 domain-containing protein n=1 Tax=Cronartium quercuum f. sp. fusiforme G11 TaxID=708437 RepID=A0A9P6TC18_9BASI|nr:hypothetical protein CROQUDRAFT_133275 [Cronartium quercuum f. sp. fusiforme G11]